MRTAYLGRWVPGLGDCSQLRHFLPFRRFAIAEAVVHHSCAALEGKPAVGSNGGVVAAGKRSWLDFVAGEGEVDGEWAEKGVVPLPGRSEERWGSELYCSEVYQLTLSLVSLGRLANYVFMASVWPKMEYIYYGVNIDTCAVKRNIITYIFVSRTSSIFSLLAGVFFLSK